jgi:hypothetical protein
MTRVNRRTGGGFHDEVDAATGQVFDGVIQKHREVYRFASVILYPEEFVFGHFRG